MNRQHLSYALTMLLILAGLAFTSPAYAQDRTPPDPQVIVDKCIESMNKIGSHVVQVNEDIAAKTIERINMLLDQDRPFAARNVARQGIERINRVDHDALSYLRNLTENCLRILHKLNAEQSLIDSVKDEARKQVMRIQKSRVEAIESIKMALPAPPAD